MKITGIIVVILIIVLGGYFLLFNNNAEQNNLENELPIDSTDGSASMEVPAPGSIGVDEMIVNDDGSSQDGVPVESGVRGETVGTTPTEGTTETVPTTEPKPEASKTVTIDYSSSGYSPKNVSISKGDTVRFVNSSTLPNWPASDFHPTHKTYPGSGISKCNSEAIIFDSCGTIKEGGSFEFTFDEVGAWKYHNHVSSSRGGTITVK